MTTPATLTHHNVAIIRLIAAGMTNAEIGAELHLGEDTIKTHLKRIFAKLDARNRQHLVAICYDEGILQRGASNPPRQLRNAAEKIAGVGQ